MEFYSKTGKAECLLEFHKGGLSVKESNCETVQDNENIEEMQGVASMHMLEFCLEWKRHRIALILKMISQLHK